MILYDEPYKGFFAYRLNITSINIYFNTFFLLWLPQEHPMFLFSRKNIVRKLAFHIIYKSSVIFAKKFLAHSIPFLCTIVSSLPFYIHPSLANKLLFIIRSFVTELASVCNIDRLIEEERKQPSTQSLNIMAGKIKTVVVLVHPTNGLETKPKLYQTILLLLTHTLETKPIPPTCYSNQTNPNYFSFFPRRV